MKKILMMTAAALMVVGCADESVKAFKMAEKSYRDARSDYNVISAVIDALQSQFFEWPPPMKGSEPGEAFEFELGFEKELREWMEKFNAAVPRFEEEFEKVEEAYRNVEKAGGKAPDLWNGPDGIALQDDHQEFVAMHQQNYNWCADAEIAVRMHFPDLPGPVQQQESPHGEPPK